MTSTYGRKGQFHAGLIPYIVLLCLSKLLRSFGVFLSYDLLKVVHIVEFLFVIKVGSAVCLVFIQKPFSSGKHISKNQWFRIVRHAFFGSVIQLLWLFGLTLCGPLRTLFIFEHSDLAVIAVVGALFNDVGGPSKFRGALFFIFAILALLLFDHDDVLTENLDTNPHDGIISQLFNHLTNLTGLSDHKGGVILLVISLAFKVGYNSASRKLSVDIGGTKRLNAFSTLISAILLLPWAILISSSKVISAESSYLLIIPFSCIILFTFVIDYYVEAVSLSRLDASFTTFISSVSILLCSLFLSVFWNHPFLTMVTNVAVIREIEVEEHVLSGGVIFSFCSYIVSMHILTSISKSSSKGNLIGYSTAGLPLYSFTSDAIQRTSNSVLTILRNGLIQILGDSNSRKIFYFLIINIIFTFVELAYGAWTNSLGLVSDGFHMLFDCSALVMGLYAAVMSKWKATKIFSYGFDRVEIISGFINGIFLIVIAFFVFTAAIGRILDPPNINTEKLLTVSVIGLIVNLFGIFAFRHSHSHGGVGHGHSQNVAHGHAHNVHSHSHGSHSHTKNSECSDNSPHSHSSRNSNMQGVFLHVLADTLGSCGVIVSSILIENFDLKVADPICSLFIAALIFVSVLPLVKETALVLLLQTPLELNENIHSALDKILHVEGVQSYRNEGFWRHSSSVVCGMLHLQTTADASEQYIIQKAQIIFKEEGINNLTVQVEKEAYFQHLTGLGVSIDEVQEMSMTMRRLKFETGPQFIKSV